MMNNGSKHKAACEEIEPLTCEPQGILAAYSVLVQFARLVVH